MLIEELVWCDAIGSTHSLEDPDPEQEGPQYKQNDPRGQWESHNDAWELHEEPFRGYPGGLWHYTCPGPHHVLYIEDGEPTRGEEVKMNTTYNERIVSFLQHQNGADVGVPDIANHLRVSPEYISSNLTKLVRDGAIRRVARGRYAIGNARNVHMKDASKTQLETMRNNPSNGDLFEYIGTSSNGKLILRQLETQTLVVATPLEV